MKKKYISMNKNEVNDEVGVVEEEIKEESKMKNFLKNNWKKFAIGAGVVLTGVGGYLLGSKEFNNNSEEFLLDDFDDEIETDAVEE